MGHSFAHCALHLIYFRLYSIADRSKSHRVLCGWLMWIQLYDRPIDRSNESHRSPFNVNLRWSRVVSNQSVDSLFHAPVIESFFFFLPFLLLHPGKSNLRTSSIDRETIIPHNGRNISSILIQRTRTMRSTSAMLLRSNRNFSNNWTQKFVSTKQRSMIHYDTWIH